MYINIYVLDVFVKAFMDLDFFPFIFFKDFKKGNLSSSLVLCRSFNTKNTLVCYEIQLIKYN